MAELKNKQRVALKSDTKHRGRIYSCFPGYDGMEDMYNVEWDDGQCYLYTRSALITEKEEKEKLKSP